MRGADLVVTVIVMDDELRLPLVRRVFSRFSMREWVAVDVVAALLIAAAVMSGIALGVKPRLSGTGWEAVRYGATGLAAAALPLRRLYPIGALALVVAGSALAVALQAPPQAVVLAALGLYSVASSSTRVTSQVALVVVWVATLSAVWAAGGDRLENNVVATALFVLVAWLAGENTRSRRVYATAVAQRAAERELEREERSRRAVAEERIVIARDLHDIVAHAMSVITVRAGVARVVMSTHPEEVPDALGIIETTARRALQEMRLLVGVLRNVEGDDGELGPAPGLASIGDLIDQAGHAGVEVTVEIVGERRVLPGGADLSVYRIIQEALTNVVRHAGPTRAQLRIEYRADDIVIEVTDEGGRKWDPPQANPASGGHGLIGMRERAALYGGALSAGPQGRGFQVRACLPITAADS
jgi:signal transduction histidine kinase